MELSRLSVGGVLEFGGLNGYGCVDWMSRTGEESRRERGRGRVSTDEMARYGGGRTRLLTMIYAWLCCTQWLGAASRVAAAGDEAEEVRSA